MPSVLVDTSTVIALALAANDKSKPKLNVDSFWSNHRDIGAGIDALILSEELIFDKASIDRCKKSLPVIEQFTHGSSMFGDMDESEIYSLILTNYLGRIDRSAATNDLFRMHTSIEMQLEVGAKRFYPSATWRDIESELEDAGAQHVSRTLKSALGNYTPYAGAACALLLRSLYYDVLQQLLGADLVLHPLKERDRVPNRLMESSVIGVFDKSARKAF